MKPNHLIQKGYTLVEMLIVLMLSVLIIVPIYQALSETMIVKKNTNAMNELRQQSRFALNKLNDLITNDLTKGTRSISNPSIPPSTTTNGTITGQSKYETGLAGGTAKYITIKVCASNLLIYSLSGNCGATDNQILASNVSIFTVDNLNDKTRYPNATLYPFSRDLIGIRLKLQEASGPNSVDAIIKVIPDGV